MTDSASELELESDTSSIDGAKDTLATNEQLSRRVESLQQENRVLKTELETLKLKIKGLYEMNDQLRRNSVNIQAKAEQEEEYISNTLLKKITELKKEKESLALNYEQEEECLTNELNRKFTQLKQEKVALERTLAREQENQITKLMRRIEKLEADTKQKQDCLDRLRREKIELENALEQEQEALVNRLWKKMEKLEAEKRLLQEKLESVGAPVPLISNSGSTNQLNTSGTALHMPPSNTSPTVHRPSSSGSLSLRNSLRQRPNSGTASTPVISPVSPSRPICLGSGEQPMSHLNQGSSLLSEVSIPKPDVSESQSGVSKLLPQSPMDVDAAAAAAGAAIDHNNTSGAPSPCGSGGQASLPTTPNHPNQLRSPSTPCAASQKLTDQIETSPSVATADTPAISKAQLVSTAYVNRLRDEVCRLRQSLQRYEIESATKMSQFESEERSVAEENRRLRKMLQIEKERREALSRQLSESESSLEMEDERQFNEASRSTRLRTTSDSNSPFHPPSSSLYGPGHAFAVALAANVNAPPGGRFCRECGQPFPSSADPSAATSMTNRLSNYNLGSRTCPGRCCSPINYPNPTDFHQVINSHSPSTPTTSSLGSDRFAKPIYPATSNTNSYYFNPVGSAISSDGHFRDSQSNAPPILSTHPTKRFMSYPTGQKDSQIIADPEDVDEDEDPRCITPPSHHQQQEQQVLTPQHDKCSS